MSNSFVTPWTVTRQAPLSMGLSRQEYWNGLPFTSPVDFSDTGMKPTFAAMAGTFFTTEASGKPITFHISPKYETVYSYKI